jgi:hypothetical protein
MRKMAEVNPKMRTANGKGDGMLQLVVLHVVAGVHAQHVEHCISLKGSPVYESS